MRFLVQMLAAATVALCTAGAAHAASGGFADFDSATGAPREPLAQVDGDVYSVARHPTDGWFLGGKFTHVAGQPRLNLAHVRADGTLSSWNPGTNGPVYCVHASTTEVFVGGDFTNIGGVLRNHLAKLNPNTGVVANWLPQPNGAVFAITQLNSDLFVGGGFTSLAGMPRERLGAVRTSTGLILTWNPGADDTVFALDFRAHLVFMEYTIFAGGKFTTVGDSARSHIAAIDAGTGVTTDWNPGGDGIVRAIDARIPNVFVGGAFQHIGGVARAYAAELDAETAVVSGWNPAPNGPVRALLVDGEAAIVGGEFTAISGGSRSGLASVRRDTAALDPWDPLVDEPAVYAVAERAGRVAAGGGFSNATGPIVAAEFISPRVNAIRALPHPVRPGGFLELALEREGSARLRLYDARGRCVAEPLAGLVLPAGRHRVAWPAGLASGVYVARLDCAGTTAEHRIAFVR